MSQEQSPSLEDNLLSRARAIAAQLGETTPESLDQIFRLLKLLGEDVVDACLVEALAIQARGGEMLPNASRPRTLGGIFFRLTRARHDEAAGEAGPLAAQSRPAPALPTRRQRMPWEARIELLPMLHEMKGRTMSVKVVLSGRPGKVERRAGTVVLIMAAGEAPPLPRGVPFPPAQPAPFACYVDAQQWAEVEPALADPNDALILDGYCAGDPETGTVAVYVQNATTRNLQRALAAAGKTKPKRATYGSPTSARSTPGPSPSSAPRTIAERAEPPSSSLPPVTTTIPATPPEAAAGPGPRFQKGMRVQHPQFGEGEVIRSEPRDGDEAVTVDFASSGLRRVLARVSGLQIIES
jgi:hypothetical protein